METRRIGNDLIIEWTLQDGSGQPYIVEGKDIEIYLNVGTVEQRATELSIHDNVVCFVFYGKDQNRVGHYGLKLIENNGGIRMVTYDIRDVFNLVPHSWLIPATQSEQEPSDNVEIQTISITSEIDVALFPHLKSIAGQSLLGDGDVIMEINLSSGSSWMAFDTASTNTEFGVLIISALDGFEAILHGDENGAHLTVHKGNPQLALIEAGDEAYFGVKPGAKGKYYVFALTNRTPGVQSLSAEEVTDILSDWSANIRWLYAKPTTGIPASDIATDVQNSLAKANKALTAIVGTIEDASSPLYIDLDLAPTTFLISGANTATWAYLVKYDDLGNTYIPKITLLAGDDVLSFDIGDDDNGDVILRISSAHYATVKFSSLSEIPAEFHTLEGGFQGATPIHVRTPYVKPSGGIPSTDLASDVQTSLGKADTSVQPSDIATIAEIDALFNNGGNYLRLYNEGAPDYEARVEVGENYDSSTTEEGGLTVFVNPPDIYDENWRPIYPIGYEMYVNEGNIVVDSETSPFIIETVSSPSAWGVI